MTELERIAALWRDCSSRGDSAVLATVIRVQGSAYRRVGARLLLTSSGIRAGSVSGGCLEADLSRKAWWLTDGGKSVVRRYDTTSDGEIAEEFGLGCNGVIDVFLERLDTPFISALGAADSVKTRRGAASLATVVACDQVRDLNPGQRCLSISGEPLSSDLGDADVERWVAEQLASLTANVPPEIRTWTNGAKTADLFLEELTPSPRVLVFGAGDDAIPMTRLAKFLGFEVFVLDGRLHLARKDRFPEADAVTVTTVEDPLGGIELDRWTSAVVMSHSYAQDQSAIRALADHPLQYVGMLGPRKRTERLISEAGIDWEWLKPILHSPMGLDIGADGAEQIALAAMAEMQAALNRRSGGTLRDKVGPLQPAEPDARSERGSRDTLACTI